MVCCSVHWCGSPDEVDICESAYQGNVTKVELSGSDGRTLAEVSLYLDGITVYGYFLARDQGSLVVGLLGGHIVLCFVSLAGTREPQPVTTNRAVSVLLS